MCNVLVTLLNDLSNSSLYEKCGSIPLSKAIMRKRFRWLGHVLQMKDDKLQKVVLFGQPSRAERKSGRPRLVWEDVFVRSLGRLGGCGELLVLAVVGYV